MWQKMSSLMNGRSLNIEFEKSQIAKDKKKLVKFKFFVKSTTLTIIIFLITILTNC
jgi:hypothetical protein